MGIYIGAQMKIQCPIYHFAIFYAKYITKNNIRIGDGLKFFFVLIV